MRKILTLSLIIFHLSFNIASAATKTQADALYEKEQYRDAAEAYEAVLKNEGVASDVYYNLGNCYYKMDEIPLAVLNYERAFLLDPGDDVMLCEPYYVSYLGQIHVCGCNPVFVPTSEENRWVPTVEDLERTVTDRTRVMIINSPNNPTGCEISREELKKIAEFAIRHDIVVISDEPYNKIRYSETPFVSISSMPGMKERTLVVNSFSKTYAMPGWRLGYAVGPEWIISQMPKTHDVTVSCVPAPFQHAGAFALKNCDKDVEEMVRRFRIRRDLVVEGINSIPGLSCSAPDGTFYLFFNIKELGVSSEEFAFGLLEDKHVALVPGNGFGDLGEGYMRLTFAKDEEDLTEAISRIREYVEKIRNK